MDLQNTTNCELVIIQIIQACNGDLEILGELMDLYDKTNP